MQSTWFSSSQAPAKICAREILFILFVALFVLVAMVWPVLTLYVHHLSTWTPDGLHTFQVREHGTTFYMKPGFGRFYVSLPWLWGALLSASVLTGLMLPAPEKHK
jgi:hypothetical protein